MPNLLAFDPVQVLGFVVIMVRISGLVVAAPILGDFNIPVTVKAAFTLMLALLFYPVVAKPELGPNPQPLALTLLLLGEFGVGLLIGFAARLMFAGISLAGEVIGFQMGLGIANVFDPSSNTQTSLIGQVQVVFALFLFVILDGHHILIRAVAESYALVGPGAVVLRPEGLQFYSGLVGNIFLIGIQIGAPLIVALLAANFSMGLIARSVPQINIFVVGFPFTIWLGLMFLALSFPFYVEALMRLHERLAEVLMMGIRTMG